LKENTHEQETNLSSPSRCEDGNFGEDGEQRITDELGRCGARSFEKMKM
jgi:hypothetical protein